MTITTEELNTFRKVKLEISAIISEYAKLGECVVSQWGVDNNGKIWIEGRGNGNHYYETTISIEKMLAKIAIAKTA